MTFQWIIQTKVSAYSSTFQEQGDIIDRASKRFKLWFEMKLYLLGTVEYYNYGTMGELGDT